MHVEEMLLQMASGTPLADEAVAAFVSGVVDGSVSRPQAAAWLAWAFARTLTDGETSALTRAMTQSGTVLSWPEGPPVVDKHSTGGVGDKVSLVLAPLWAELGLRVPMISGRGLGHTGGTLDKLESIPGFRTDLPLVTLQEVMAAHGLFLAGQTADLAPADRVLYALRDEIQAVASRPLIVASILSKKLAEGLDRLVLDVKVGSGAFLTSPDETWLLAEALVRTANAAGVTTRAWITEMSSPLGCTVGNALEVREAIECLRGGGPADLRDLVLAFAEHPRAAEVLDSGKALERFARVIEAQGGDPSVVDHPERLLGGGCTEYVVTASHGGVVEAVEAREVAWAAFGLGAGRRRAGAPIDPGVGLDVRVRPGDTVVPGQTLVIVHHRDGHGLDEALARLASAIEVGDGPVVRPPLIHDVIDGPALR